MLETLFNNFVVLFVVVDPISLAPVFMALTEGNSARHWIALRAVSLSAVILIVFFFAGARLLALLGVGLEAFRIAGGLLLFLLAIDMVFARQSGLRSTTVRERAEAARREDISVFPLAFPLLAGPGALTTTLLMAARADAPAMAAGMVLVILLVMVLAGVVLLVSHQIMQTLGETGANMVTRLFGVILTALAVQFVIDGVNAIFPPQ